GGEGATQSTCLKLRRYPETVGRPSRTGPYGRGEGEGPWRAALFQRRASGEGTVRDLSARRYFLAPSSEILMPGAKQWRQALRSLTRRCAPTSLPSGRGQSEGSRYEIESSVVRNVLTVVGEALFVPLPHFVVGEGRVRVLI